MSEAEDNRKPADEASATSGPAAAPKAAETVKAAAEPPKVAVDPSLEREASRISRPSSEPAGSGSTPSPRAHDAEPALSDLPAGRRWLGLPAWGWVVGLVSLLAALFVVSDIRNQSRFVLVCQGNKVELQQGRRFPWPFGLEPLGGPEYKPIAISAEADCRNRTFETESDAARGFLDTLVGQVRSALANPGTANLRDARQQLIQAMMLTRSYRDRRKEAQELLAELSYREGRASLARAENELRLALSRFQEAQKQEGSRFEDLDQWIGQIEEILRVISPSPFSSPTLPALPHGPLPSLTPKSGSPQPTSRPAGSAPPVPPPPGAPRPDAGPPPAGGDAALPSGSGILM